MRSLRSKFDEQLSVNATLARGRELWAIAWIQNRFMETPFLRAAFQVVLGGALVFAAGVLIGGG